MKRSHTIESITFDVVQKDFDRVPVLGPMDLAVTAGSYVALTGPNGSGKSTLLRLAAGLLEPTGGNVFVHGARAGSQAARRRSTYIPDAPVFFDDLDVQDHLEYLSSINEISAWRARSDQLLLQFDVEDSRRAMPRTLSRGLRQRVALVLGLLKECDVILIDEPFVGLDRRSRVALRDVLSSRNRAGATVVVASHDDGLLEDVSRVVVLREGALAYDGTATDMSIDDA